MATCIQDASKARNVGKPLSIHNVFDDFWTLNSSIYPESFALLATL
jgi:hypothetical protein